MEEGAKSDDIDTHTKTSTHPPAQRGDRAGRQVRQARRDAVDGGRARPSGTLCDLEQAFVLKAIREDIDLTRHMDDAVQIARRLPCRRRERAQRRAPSNSRRGTRRWAR